MSKTDFASKNLKDRVTALERKMAGYFLNETIDATILNIDTINNQNGYIYRIHTSSSGNLGTQPTSIIQSNAYILIGFSAINSQQKPVYGVQIAFGFGTNKIAIRNTPYTTGGGSWGAWTAI